MYQFLNDMVTMDINRYHRYQVNDPDRAKNRGTIYLRRVRSRHVLMKRPNASYEYLKKKKKKKKRRARYGIRISIVESRYVVSLMGCYLCWDVSMDCGMCVLIRT